MAIIDINGKQKKPKAKAIKKPKAKGPLTKKTTKKKRKTKLSVIERVSGGKKSSIPIIEHKPEESTFKLPDIDENGRRRTRTVQRLNITKLFQPKDYTYEQIALILEIWLSFFLESGRKVVFPKLVNDALRHYGYSITDLTELIAEAKAVPRELGTGKKKVPRDKKYDLIEYTLKIIDIEIDNARNETLSETHQGLIFLRQAQDGYSIKQEIKVTAEVSLDSIIKQNLKTKS